MIEVNPHVIALRGQFNIPDDERLTIIQADAADYLPVAEGDSDVLLLDGCDADGIAPMFLNRAFYQSARRRLRPSGMLVANFVDAPHDWRQHLALLDEVFEHRVYLARVSCEGNHIAFAFADVGYPLDWLRLAARDRTRVPSLARFPCPLEATARHGESWMAMRHLAHARPSIR